MAKKAPKPAIGSRRRGSYVSGSEKTYAAKNDDQPFYGRGRTPGKPPTSRSAPRSKSRR